MIVPAAHRRRPPRMLPSESLVSDRPIMSGLLDGCQRTMRNMRIYLDHNATTPLVASARAAMTEALDVCGNPSSIHAEGRSARDRIEVARHHVATLVGGAPDEIVFTSGGTEADCLGVVGLARAARRAGRPARVLLPPI